MKTIERLHDDLRRRSGVRHENVVDTEYFKSARTGEVDVIKSPERMKVLRHILDNHANVFPQILTNPGLHWRFERAIENERGEYRQFFVGVERSWQVLENSLKYMPGRKKMSIEKRGLGGVVTSGAVTAKGVLVHSEIESYCELAKSHGGQGRISGFKRHHHMRCRQRFSDMLGRLTAFWVDVFSPLGTVGMAKFLRSVPSIFYRGCPIPFAISFQYGRDAIVGGQSKDPLERRAEMVRIEMEKSGLVFLEIQDYWWYFNLNESRIATVTGIAYPVENA